MLFLCQLFTNCARPNSNPTLIQKYYPNEIGASSLRREKINLLFIIFESNYKFQILLSNREIIIVLIIKYFLIKNMPIIGIDLSHIGVPISHIRIDLSALLG